MPGLKKPQLAKLGSDHPADVIRHRRGHGWQATGSTCGDVVKPRCRKTLNLGREGITWCAENRWNQLSRHTGGTARCVLGGGATRNRGGLQAPLARGAGGTSGSSAWVQPAPAGDAPPNKGRCRLPSRQAVRAGRVVPGRSGNSGRSSQRRLPAAKAVRLGARKPVAPAGPAAVTLPASGCSRARGPKAAPAVSVPAEPE